MSLLGGLGSTYSQAGENWGQTNGSSIGGTFGSAQALMDFNREMMREANKFSAEEAQKNRDWQQEMSSTAFQRAVEDMKKAGINPILAAGSQASTPSGSAAQAHMAQGALDTMQYSQNSGMNYGYNSAYSYSNLAEGLKGLADLFAQMTPFGSVDSIKDAMVDLGSKAGKAVSSALDQISQGERLSGSNWLQGRIVGGMARFFRGNGFSAGSGAGRQ